MEQKSKQILKDDYGFEVFSAEEKAAELKSKRMLSVVVDIKMPLATNPLAEIILERPTKRNTLVYMSNFTLKGDVFSFRISSAPPKEFFDYFVKSTLPIMPMATTFPDFCWLLSEGTTAKNVGEVATSVRDDVTLGDLTWVLPTKFSDDIIEAIHSLNLFLLEGAMQDAILYGPFVD